MPLRLNRRQLIELIEAIEVGGGDAGDLRRELEILEPPAGPPARPAVGALRAAREEETTGDRLNREVGDLFPQGVTGDTLSQLIELDGKYSMRELKDMCVKAGLSPNGHKKKLAAKLIARGVIEVRLPQTITPAGKCYEDAWRFLLKQEEGELIHGTVLSEGRRIGHAWVELPSGYIWEPQTGQYYYTPKAFAIAASPEEESRYTAAQASIMAARTKNLGPWSEEEKRRWTALLT